MSITKTLVVSLVSKIVIALMSVVSKEIKYLLQSYIKDLYRRAKQTSNPADDLFIEFIAEILCVELEDKDNKEKIIQDSNDI